MLLNPKHGWVTVKIGEWSDRASYLTDVPLDILSALIHSYQTGLPAAINFDAEGWEYIIVIDHYTTHIIDYLYRTDEECLSSEDDKQILTVVEISKDDLAKEFLEDIESDWDAWVNWMYYDDEETIQNRKSELGSKIKILKSLMEVPLSNVGSASLLI